MKRRIAIDPAAPLRSLREGAGLTQTALADLRGVRQGSVSESESAGAGAELRTLVATADALGYEVTITAAPRKRARAGAEQRAAARVLGVALCAGCEGGRGRLCETCRRGIGDALARAPETPPTSGEVAIALAFAPPAPPPERYGSIIPGLRSRAKVKP